MPAWLHQVPAQTLSIHEEINGADKKGLGLDWIIFFAQDKKSLKIINIFVHRNFYATIWKT